MAAMEEAMAVTVKALSVLLALSSVVESLPLSSSFLSGTFVHLLASWKPDQVPAEAMI